MFAQAFSKGQHAIMNIFWVKVKQDGLNDALIKCSCETCHMIGILIACHTQRI